MFSPDLASLTPVSLSLAKQQRLDALLQIPNAQQRLGLIVDAARGRVPLPDVLRIDAHRVPGCMVRTWFVPELRDGRCYFHTDSDAAMLKALLALFCDIYSGQTPEEIAADDGEFLKEVGVIHQIAENRQRTVLRVAEQAREFAEAHVSAIAFSGNLAATRQSERTPSLSTAPVCP